MSEPADDRWWWELWEQLDEVPETAIGEIVGGEVRAVPRAGLLHARTATQLRDMLVGPFGQGEGGPGGWVIVPEPPIRFGDELRVPDLAGWRSDAFPWSEQGPTDVAPAWICEVLSASTAQSDRAQKLPLYGEHGVAHAWLVDPEAQTLEIYRRESDVWVVASVHAADAKVRAEPFDAIELDLSLVWPQRTS